ALEKVLLLISVDERAHYDFFLKIVRLYLDYDRAGTLEYLRHVANTFNMPSYHLLADSARRAAAIKALHIFDEEIYYHQVFEPAMAALGLTRADLRQRKARPALAAPGSP